MLSSRRAFGAIFLGAHAPRYFQERLLPRDRSHNPRPPAPLCPACRCFWLFRLSRRDRRQIFVATDRRLAEMVATIEQEYGNGESDQCTENGAERSVRCAVARHHDLR